MRLLKMQSPRIKTVFIGTSTVQPVPIASPPWHPIFLLTEDSKFQISSAGEYEVSTPTGRHVKLISDGGGGVFELEPRVIDGGHPPHPPHSCLRQAKGRRRVTQRGAQAKCLWTTDTADVVPRPSLSRDGYDGSRAARAQALGPALSSSFVPPLRFANRFKQDIAA